jgi:hypothetical protein
MPHRATPVAPVEDGLEVDDDLPSDVESEGTAGKDAL